MEADERNSPVIVVFDFIHLFVQCEDINSRLYILRPLLLKLKAFQIAVFCIY
jgi:hypothetical protein